MRRFSSFLVFVILVVCMPHGLHAETNVQTIEREQSASIVRKSLQESSRVNILFQHKIDYTLLENYNAKIIHTYQKIPAVTVELQPQLLADISKESAVKSVTKDQIVQSDSQTVSWGYNEINLANMYPSTLSGKGVKIAIIDSGIDDAHPDLKVAGGKCVLDDVDLLDACAHSFYDDDGHGTHVAGIIAAQDNNIGVLGVAPDAAIYGIKALDRKGIGSTSSIMAALDWAIKNKVDIINMSLTYTYDEPAIHALVKQASDQGILIIAAAGNKRHPTGLENNVQYPGKYPEVIAVSSLGKNNDLIATSSIGDEVELTAPGGSIYSTKPVSQNSYGTMSGTSMAAPFVTGIAALYMEKYPDLAATEIRGMLQMNAKDLGEPGRDARFGYGLVQADSIIQNEMKVDAIPESNGKINISISNLPEEASSYNLYRFDQKIISNSKETQIVDYGSKGMILYKLVPIIDGKEDVTKATIFQATLSSPDLVDVLIDDWFNRHMMYLKSEKIMNGYSQSELKPFDKITRNEAVMLLVNALRLPLDEKAQSFKDVELNALGAGHIGAAVKNGILQGFSDGTFRGQQYVTRAEMSIMIVNGYQLSPASTSISFKDVNASVTGYDQINRLAFHRIAAGYSDGTFRPNEQMNRATYAVFLAKAANEKLK